MISFCLAKVFAGLLELLVNINCSLANAIGNHRRQMDNVAIGNEMSRVLLGRFWRLS